MLDRHGKPKGVWRFDSAGANRALELMGRYLARDAREGDGRPSLSGRYKHSSLLY
jgi:hypothetical protein